MDGVKFWANSEENFPKINKQGGDLLGVIIIIISNFWGCWLEHFLIEKGRQNNMYLL